MDYLSLADWRRQVSEMYTTARSHPRPVDAWLDFCATRHRLFENHPQSPLNENQRQRFSGLVYYPYDESYRVTARINSNIDPQEISIDLGDDGEFSIIRIARLDFEIRAAALSLYTYWVKGYGGGLFLPFRDVTNGLTTYGGGRYLYDTIKGADLGAREDTLLLDFNYAYNPSCAYNDRWVCPLSPADNRLKYSIEAGEKFKQTW